jgi:hypothetical protein
MNVENMILMNAKTITIAVLLMEFAVFQKTEV